MKMKMKTTLSYLYSRLCIDLSMIFDLQDLRYQLTEA